MTWDKIANKYPLAYREYCNYYENHSIVQIMPIFSYFDSVNIMISIFAEDRFVGEKQTFEYAIEIYDGKDSYCMETIRNGNFKSRNAVLKAAYTKAFSIRENQLRLKNEN